MALLREFWSRQQPPRHHCGHFRTWRDENMASKPNSWDREAGAKKSEWVAHVFFCIVVLFLHRDRVHEICVSEEIATARSRHASRSASDPDAWLTRAIVRAVTATKHEPGLSPSFRVVSPDDIALSSSACTQRSVRRGAALASRLDPLTLSGDKRGRSKALLLAVLNGTLFLLAQVLRIKFWQVVFGFCVGPGEDLLKRLPSVNGQLFRFEGKTSPSLEVCLIVVPFAVAPSAVSGR